MKQFILISLTVIALSSCKKTEDKPNSIDIRDQFAYSYLNSEATIKLIAEGDTFDQQTFKETFTITHSKSHSDRIEFSTPQDGFLFYADAIETIGDTVIFQVPFQKEFENNDTSTIEGNKLFLINSKQCSGYLQNGIIHFSIKVEFTSLPGAIVYYEAVLKK